MLTKRPWGKKKREKTRKNLGKGDYWEMATSFVKQGAGHLLKTSISQRADPWGTSKRILVVFGVTTRAAGNTLGHTLFVMFHSCFRGSARPSFPKIRLIKLTFFLTGDRGPPDWRTSSVTRFFRRKSDRNGDFFSLIQSEKRWNQKWDWIDGSHSNR